MLPGLGSRQWTGIDTTALLTHADFGLAVLFDPAQLPCTDLGLEGTPWYALANTLVPRVERVAGIWDILIQSTSISGC